jgi:hypothetical protein
MAGRHKAFRSQAKDRSASRKTSSFEDLVAKAKSCLDEARAEVEQELAIELEWGEPEEAYSSNRDGKEDSRATVRSACVAAEQRFLRSGGNPRHAWEAICMCTSFAVAPMMLPDWCVPYLHQAAKGLLDAKGDGEKLTAFIAKQLKFTRNGSTAIKDSASAARAISAALRYDKLCFCDGMSSGKAYEEVRKQEGLADVSSARKLVKRGHDMLRHTPASP